MNASPFVTLTWIQWQRSRWVLAALPLLAFVADSLLLLLRDLGLSPHYFGMAAYMPMIVVSAIAIGTLLLTHSDVEKLHVALPLRILRLPCSTWKLAVGLMLFGLCAVGVVSSIASFLLRYMLQVEFQWWLPPAFSVMSLAMLQVWSYGLRNPDPRVAAFSFIGLLAPILFILTRDVTFRALTEISPLVFLIVVPLAMYLLALASLTVNRRGGLPALLPSVFDRKRKRIVEIKTRPRFRSKYRTQLWCEWRQFGWMLPLLVVFILVLYFMGMPLLIGLFGGTGGSQGLAGEQAQTSIYVSYLSNAQWTIGGLTFAAIVSSLFVGAVMFMKAGYWNTQSTYLLSMPAPTRTLARARVMMSLQSAFVSMLILGGIMGMITFSMKLAGENNRILHFLQQGYRVDFFGESAGYVPGYQVIVFYLGFLLVTMWVATWSVNAGWALLVYLVTVGPSTGFQWLMKSGEGQATQNSLERIESWSNAGTNLAMVILIATLLWIVFGAIRNRLVTPGLSIFSLVFWALVIFVFYVFSKSYIHLEEENLPGGRRWPHPVHWPTWFGLSMMIIAPFFSHAYLLHKARHR